MEKKGKEAKAKVLWKLFISTLYLSAFTFGGGYVIVTLMKEKFVDQLHWIKEDEMLCTGLMRKKCWILWQSHSLRLERSQ